MLVALQNMVGALTTSREQQQRLVMDASRELRTPLTAVRTNIEVLARFLAIRTRPGSGLGLAIVKEIATLHDGTITLTERIGSGTDAALKLLNPTPIGAQGNA